MNAIKRMATFNSEAGRAHDGVCVVFDIAGFSQFFNQPDVHSYVSGYLTQVIQCVETCIFGGDGYWKPDAERMLPPLALLPICRKFLGDGCMYLWSPDESRQVTPDFLTTLTSRLFDLRKGFDRVSKLCQESIPVAEMPKGIRFAIARGTVFELRSDDAHAQEFIGVSINLASRLLRYCANIDFIVSARLNLPKASLEPLACKKVVASRIKDFSREIVLVGKADYDALDATIKKSMFEDFES